jgi:hypothetical protein
LTTRAPVPKARILLWAASSLAALLLYALNDAVAIAAVVVGAVAAVALLPDSWHGRCATVVALAPAAIGPDAPSWAFVVAAAVVVLWPSPAVSLVPREWGHLQRHLERARRRSESAHVLVVALAPEVSLTTEALTGAFRLTDSVSLQRNDDGWLITAVLDDHKLDRAGLERRLAERFPAPVNVGWARFPQDGYTLEGLADVARAATAGTTRRRASRRAEVLPAPAGAEPRSGS